MAETQVTAEVAAAIEPVTETVAEAVKIGDEPNNIKTLMSFLPDLKGKSVLQLGNNEIFIRLLSEQGVSRLVVVDPAEDFVETYKELNASHSNLTFLKGDLLKLDVNNQKFDLVLVNDLMTNLNENDSMIIIENSLKHLNAGGHFLFRETCFQEINEIQRNPIEYIDMVQSKEMEEDDTKYAFDLIFAKPNKSISADEVNANKVSFLFSKIKIEKFHGYKSLKEFMDHKQYSRNGILRYERIFGAGFVSTGGVDTTLMFLKGLDLQPGQKVLDVGCGIGGGDFFMAKEYKVEVIGMDLSSNMVGIAYERAQEEANKELKCHFEIGDITKQNFPNGYFDVIYSRDTLLHIADKKKLFAQFKDWLKPGGKVFITDYCCGPKPWSDEFTVYVAERGYSLLTPTEYGDIFKSLNYTYVRADEVTHIFVDCLNKELKKLAEVKDAFVNDFSLEDYNYLVDGWEAKKKRCAAGYQKWGLFYVEK